MDNLSLGKLGERISSEYLQRKGYKIIEMNFHKRWGEIDIVAIDPKASPAPERYGVSEGKDVLVFVEVKTRMEYDFITPEESITPWKIRLLKRTALFYKNIHKELPELLRIDFVGVVLDQTFNPVKINLIKNITE